MQSRPKILCLAVDDEPPALSILRQYINAVPGLELAGACPNAIEANEYLQRQHVDLIFLDIQMPQLLGTDFIKTLPSPPKIIFTTAYRKFAVEGFDLNAVDFLLKPIQFDRFIKAVNKVRAYGHHEMDVSSYSDANEKYLHVRSERKMVKVMLTEILFIESQKDYVKIVTSRGTVVTKQSISSVEQMLPKEHFVRIHRSFIVSMSKIESYTSDMVEIANKEFPISRMYKHDVEKTIKSFNL